MARMVATVIALSPVVTVYSPPPSKRNSATTDTAPVSVAKSPLSARASIAKDIVRALWLLPVIIKARALLLSLLWPSSSSRIRIVKSSALSPLRAMNVGACTLNPPVTVMVANLISAFAVCGVKTAPGRKLISKAPMATNSRVTVAGVVSSCWSPTSSVTVAVPAPDALSNIVASLLFILASACMFAALCCAKV